MKKNIITFLVAAMIVSVSVTPALAKQNSDKGKATPPGQAKKIEQLKVEKNSEQENEEGKKYKEKKYKAKKYKGLPYGLGKRKDLPPGLAEKLQLPPGLSKKIEEELDKEFNEEKVEDLVDDLNELIEKVTKFTEDEENLLIYSEENINNLKKLVEEAKVVIVEVDMEDFEATIDKLSKTIKSLKAKYKDVVNSSFATTDNIREYNEYYTKILDYIDVLTNKYEESFGEKPGQYPLERFMEFYEVVYAEKLIKEDAKITSGELAEIREILKEAFTKFEESKITLEESQEEKVELLEQLIDEAVAFVAIPENTTEYNKSQVEVLKKVITQAQYLMVKMSNEAIVVTIEELDSMIISLQESLGKAKLVRKATVEEIKAVNNMITTLKGDLDEIEAQVGTIYTIKEYIAYYNFIYDLELIDEDTVGSIVDLNKFKNKIEDIVNQFIVKKQPR